MDTKDIQLVKQALVELLPELMSQALQSNKYELSGLHREINNKLTENTEALKLLTENSIKNTVRIENIEKQTVATNGKVAEQEKRWQEQTILNTKIDGDIDRLKESEKTRSADEKSEVKNWKGRIITGLIALGIIILTATGILTIPK